MNSIDVEFLEEYKFVDAICRDMLHEEKGVSAYIEQMKLTPMSVRLKIFGWENDYKTLNHFRWVRNKIVHDTGFAECTLSDVESLKRFHNRLLTQQDPLANVYQIKRKGHLEKDTLEDYAVDINTKAVKKQLTPKHKTKKRLIAIACITVFVLLLIFFLWFIIGLPHI